MKRIKRTSLLAITLALAVAGSQATRFLHADTPMPPMARPVEPSLANLAALATNDDPAVSKPAIDKLRAAGPAGLDVLLATCNPQIASHRNGTAVLGGGNDKTWPRITAALDTVAAQHDAYASGLYWYTDFPSAQAAAKASGKPILSLRLLGNLNDEYSCANSRFFRTVLYANSDVAKHLSDHFILHWQSVRPVPVITIDFGDGRIIRRTITGNSIHYVLTADGTVVDAIPGLYGPKAFLRELYEAEKGFAGLAKATNQPTDPMLWHAQQASRISSDFDKDLTGAGVIWTPPAPTPLTPSASSYERSYAVRFGLVVQPALGPPAISAAPLASTKALVEMPIVQQVQPAPLFSQPLKPVVSLPKDPTEIGSEDWSRIAAMHSDDAVLDQSSHALMEAKTVDAVTAARRAMSKMYVEDPLVKTIANFQRSIAEDTVRNEYLYHLQIHRWLADPANASLANDVNALNKKVYAELFLTPDSDPWLGLVPADTYTALDGAGICTPPK